MLALPIARRELLGLSRAATTWQKRLVPGLAMFIVGIGFALIHHYVGPRVLTSAIHMLGASLSFMCLFVGITLTADSIAQEKREGTLGLLFLTNLSSFEIVLGKFVAHAVMGFYSVLYALPLLSMSLIFGGIRLGDVLMYVVSAMNFFFFSAAVGLFASSISLDKRKAHGLGTFVVIFFWLTLPVLALGLTRLGAPRWLIDVLARCSINMPIALGIGLGRLLPSTTGPWWNLAWTHILGWAFIGLATWALPRCWQDQSSRNRLTLREMWKTFSLGKPATRLKLRRRLLDRNAFMWLASRDRLQTLAIWLIILSMLAILGVQIVTGVLQPAILIGMGVAISLMLQLAVSTANVAQLLREYEQGTLELILSTPLSVHELLRGQFSAARRQFRTLLAFTFLLLWTGVAWLIWQGPRRFLLGISVVAIYSGLFLLNCYAIGWVSMWSVTKAPDPKKAQSNGFFYVTILPAIIFGLIVACANFLNLLFVVRLSAGPGLLLPFAVILALGNCIYWLRRAKRELPGQLRPFAFRRYTPQDRPTLFGLVGRIVSRFLHRAAL